jgi:hypothetical protein
MPIPDWTDAPTQTELDEWVTKQTINLVTSAGHPSPGNPMRVIGETNNLALLADDGTDFREIMRLGAWHSFTPTIDGATSDPARVNGTWSGQYVLLGNLGLFMWQITFGSSDTFGSGEWRLTLPDGLTTYNSVAFRLGTFHAYDASTAANDQVLVPFLHTSDATLIRVGQVQGGVANISNTVPFTWVSTDQLNGFALVPLDL